MYPTYLNMIINDTQIKYGIVCMIMLIGLLYPSNIVAGYNNNLSSKEKALKKELSQTQGPKRLKILQKLMTVSYGTPLQVNYIKQLAKEGEQYDSLAYTGQALTELCCFYTNNKGADSVLKYAPKAMEVNAKINKSSHYYIASSLYCSALCSNNKFNQAITEGFKLYEKAKRENDKIGIPQACEIIGNIYSKMFINDEAIKYLKEEMDWYNKYPPENYTLKLQNYLDLLPLLIYKEHYKEVLQYCDIFDKEIKSQEYLEVYKWAIKICKLWIRASKITAYSYTGLLPKAAKLIPFTEKELEDMDYGTIITCKLAEADYYYKKGDYQKAYNAISYTTEIQKVSPNKLDMYLDVYEKTGHTKEALMRLKEMYYHNDSTQNLRITEQLSQFNSQFQLGKLKDENIRIKQHESEMIIYYISTIATLLFIIVCIVTYYYRKEKHINGMLKETTADLKVALVKADEASRLKSSFLQNVSHELRTPLNAIVGFSSYFSEKEEASSEDKEVANLIGENSNNLLNMVGKLLDISKFESNSVNFEFKPCNLSKLIPDITQAANYSNNIDERINLYCNIPQGEDIIVTTDGHHIRKIIEHMLENSIKFTQEGSIVLGLEKCQNNNECIISVTDTGCGISKDKQEEIFNIFTKGNQFSNGIGLGLPICKLISEHINSSIEIDSTYSNGTRFIIHTREAKNKEK